MQTLTDELTGTLYSTLQLRTMLQFLSMEYAVFTSLVLLEVFRN